MYISGSPWPFLNLGDRSKALTVTKEQVQRQLALVTELRKSNSVYLQNYERAWVDDIIDIAVAVVVDPFYQECYSPQPERTSPNPIGLRERLNAIRLMTNSKEPPPHHERLEILLGSAKALNSAHSLLSCCYDRWLWMKSSKDSQIGFGPTTQDLEEFLEWKRKNAGFNARPLHLQIAAEKGQSTIEQLRVHTSRNISIDTSEDAEPPLSILDNTSETLPYEALGGSGVDEKQFQRRKLDESQKPESDETPCVTPALSSAILVQLARPGRPVVVSNSDFLLYPLDCDKGVPTHSCGDLGVDLSNYDSPHANLMLPYRPLSRETGFHSGQTSQSQLGTPPSSTSQTNSSPHLEPSPILFVKSLQNSFDKESIPVVMFQAPGPRPPLQEPPNIKQGVSSPLPGGDSASDDSLLRSGTAQRSPAAVDQPESKIGAELDVKATASSPEVTNESISSPPSTPSNMKTTPRSRGRMLLEQHEELEWRKPPLPPRPS